jgi:hypothetical protein
MAVEDRERIAGAAVREARRGWGEEMQERVGGGVWQLIGRLAWRRQQTRWRGNGETGDEVEGKRGARRGGDVTLSGGGGSGRCWIWIRWLGKEG